MSGNIDFEACATREYSVGSESKTKWTQIGVGFINKNGITVKLDALPVDANIVLLKPKPNDYP